MNLRVEADVVADSGPLTAAERIAVHEPDGFIVVDDDLLHRILMSGELDCSFMVHPILDASDVQIGVAAIVGCGIYIVGFVGMMKTIGDATDASAHRRVVNGRKRQAMGNGDMDAEEDLEEEEAGEQRR
ncbi:hypothetical protein ABZP36_016768 [Zizania latifolia]